MPRPSNPLWTRHRPARSPDADRETQLARTAAELERMRGALGVVQNAASLADAQAAADDALTLGVAP